MTRRFCLLAASLLLPLTSAAFAQDQADLEGSAEPGRGDDQPAVPEWIMRFQLQFLFPK